MITKQSILERKLQFMDDREKARVERDRLTELFHALSGAIQDCDWFISQLEAEGGDESPPDTP